jgi:hypothetical protein
VLERRWRLTIRSFDSDRHFRSLVVSFHTWTSNTFTALLFLFLFLLLFLLFLVVVVVV